MVEDGVNKCLACSRTIKGNHSKSKYHNYNKTAILADYAKIGQTSTCKKWNIPSGTIVGLVRRWGVKPLELPALELAKTGEAGPFGLPAWSDSWGEELQLKWLEMWFYIYTKKELGGVKIEQADQS